ncbi:hypothetical protein BDF21DRAFT_430474 [Thamnidium elegans]|nr:hypothetical protein BDF21DRAFT_430474 [Thamnidium elegans]
MLSTILQQFYIASAYGTLFYSNIPKQYNEPNDKYTSTIEITPFGRPAREGPILTVKSGQCALLNTVFYASEVQPLSMFSSTPSGNINICHQYKTMDTNSFGQPAAPENLGQLFKKIAQ